MSDQNIFVALRYRDASAALGWLKKAFGFEERSVYRDDAGGIGHAELTIGGGILMLSPHRDDGWLGGHAPDPLAAPMSIYVIVDDPDEHYRRAKTEGATIVAELTDMDYGSREYSARDPEGNLWSFGTYNPNAAG